MESHGYDGDEVLRYEPFRFRVGDYTPAIGGQIEMTTKNRAVLRNLALRDQVTPFMIIDKVPF